MFAQAKPAEKSTQQSAQALQASMKPKLVDILDEKKSRMINIMLGRFRRPNSQIAQQIKSLDEELTEEECQSLKTNFPTVEEIQSVEAYDGDKSLLGKAEQFVLAVGSVKLAVQHVNFLLLRKTFDSQMEDVENPINYYLSSLKAVRESPNLKQLLAILLRIGNIVNGGTNRGGCYGFKLDFLEKVKDTKTVQPQYNLTNFIAEFYPVDNLVNDLSGLKMAIATDIDTAKKTFNQIKGTFTSLKNVMPQADNLVTEGYTLASQFKKFETANKDKLEGCPKKFEQIDSEFKELVTSYGEEPDKIKISDFLSIFYNLSNDLKRAKEENNKPKPKPRPAGPASAMPGGVRNAPTIPDSGEAQRGVLDELMKKLQAGPSMLRRVPQPGPSSQPPPPQPQANDLQNAFNRVKKT